jgi:AcrR family transcriptional regulator
MAGRKPDPSKRTQILRAATEVFSAREFHVVPVEDVAVAAGVGKGTLYLYFPTKEHLLYATVLDALDVLLQDVQTAVRGRRGEEALEGFVTTVLGFFWQRRHLTVLMHRYEHLRHEPAGGEWRARRTRFVALARAVLDPDLRAAGLTAADLTLATEMLLAQIRAAVLNHQERDRPERVSRLIVGMFLHGVGRGRRPMAPRRARAGRLARAGS